MQKRHKQDTNKTHTKKKTDPKQTQKQTQKSPKIHKNTQKHTKNTQKHTQKTHKKHTKNAQKNTQKKIQKKTQKKTKKRHNSRVVKIRNNVGQSSAVNTAQILQYSPQSYASQAVLRDVGRIDGLRLPPLFFLILICLWPNTVF